MDWTVRTVPLFRDGRLTGKNCFLCSISHKKLGCLHSDLDIHFPFRLMTLPSYLIILDTLIHKVPVTTTADHRLFFHSFSEKIRLDILSESSARQRIHMKHQALFSSKDKSKKIKVLSAAILLGCSCQYHPKSVGTKALAE